MAKADATAPAPAPAGKSGSFVARELHGATFLTLEHIAHMASVVLVPAFIVAGIYSALSMWAGLPGIGTLFSSAALMSVSSKALEAALSLGVIAALLVLTPALLVLDRRTRAEWLKRPGYGGRLAYKVPIYIALAVLGISTAVIVIEMLHVVLMSLAFIGIANAPIGSLYVNEFIPLFIGLIVVVGVAWYVFTLAKGVDNGRLFSTVAAVLATAVIVALLITSLVILHNGDNSFQMQSPMMGGQSTTMYDDRNFQDLMNQLYR